MFSWIFDRWSKSRSFTSDELALLRILLPPKNECNERLFAQAENAPYVVRKLVGTNRYDALIPYVMDVTLLIDCDEDIESPAVCVTATSGVPLTFNVAILRGGFLRGLTGCSPEGTAWPKQWKVEQAGLLISKSVGSWVPETMSNAVKSKLLSELLEWSGIFAKERADLVECENIRIAKPATEEVLLSCEARLQSRLGSEHRRLLTITNGFAIQRGRPYEVLGTKDMDFVTDSREWLCVTPLYEEGCIAIQYKGGASTDECFLLTGDGRSTPVGNIKRYVQKSLLRQDGGWE